MNARPTAVPPARVVLGVAAIVAVVDWATKAVATVTLADAPVEVGLITFRLSHNPGISFSLGDQLPGPLLIVLTAMLTGVLAVAAVRGMFPSPVAAGLVLGGAAANLGDRIVGGTVVDFLDLGWWPSFNAADVALFVGCGLLALMSFRTDATERTGSSV